jgi:hypothetical protein
MDSILTELLIRHGPLAVLVCWFVLRADKREERITKALLSMRAIVCPLRAADYDGDVDGGGEPDAPPPTTHERRRGKHTPPAVLSSAES